MFLKKVLKQPNLVGSMLIALMVCGGFVYAVGFDGFNVQTVTGSEVEAWLAAAGGGSSGGSGGGGSDDMSPESPTPENPEDDEEEDEDREEGGTEDTPPEDPEDDGEGNGEGEDAGEDGFDWNSIDMKDTSTWPSVPSGGTYGISGTFTVGLASKDKYGERRGEKSLYDSNGGEWCPHKPDSSHDPHWNYKPYLWNDNQNMNIGQWIGVDLSGERYN